MCSQRYSQGGALALSRHDSTISTTSLHNHNHNHNNSNNPAPFADILVADNNIMSQSLNSAATFIMNAHSRSNPNSQSNNNSNNMDHHHLTRSMSLEHLSSAIISFNTSILGSQPCMTSFTSSQERSKSSFLSSFPRSKPLHQHDETDETDETDEDEDDFLFGDSHTIDNSNNKPIKNTTTDDDVRGENENEKEEQQQTHPTWLHPTTTRPCPSCNGFITEIPGVISSRVCEDCLPTRRKRYTGYSPPNIKKQYMEAKKRLMKQAAKTRASRATPTTLPLL